MIVFKHLRFYEIENNHHDGNQRFTYEYPCHFDQYIKIFVHVQNFVEIRHQKK